MAIQIHTKTGVEKTLLEILSAWRSTYPAKYRFFKSALSELRKVRKNPDASYVDQAGRSARLMFQVPTELWLFIQRRIPGFGKDFEDVKILLRVARDFDARQHLKPRRIYTSGKKRETSDESQRSHHSKGSGDILSELFG